MQRKFKKGRGLLIFFCFQKGGGSLERGRNQLHSLPFLTRGFNIGGFADEVTVLRTLDEICLI